MKKITFARVVPISLITLFAIFSLTTCQTLMGAFQEPTVSLHSVELASINLNGAQLLCKVQVRNPNSFEIPFPETNWQLFINNNAFINGTVRNNNKLGRNSTTIVEVPVNLEYLGLINSFRSLMGTRQVGYKVALGMTIALPVLGDKTWNFEHEGTLPLPQMPQISRPTVNIENANTTRAILNVRVNVQNPNPFPVPTPRITYDYQLNRNSFIRGNIESESQLAPNATTPVTFQMIVNYADLFRSFTTMRNLFEVPSLLIVTCDFGIPIFGTQPQRFEVSGTLPVLR